MADDKIAVTLAEVREELESSALLLRHGTDPGARLLAAAGLGSIARIALAAVEAVLKRAGQWDADAAGLDRDVTQGRKSPYPGDHALSDTDEALARELRQCADGLRADVLAALTGKDKTDD